MGYILFGVLFFGAIFATGWVLKQFLYTSQWYFRVTNWGTRVVLGLLSLWMFAMTSYISVGPNQVAQLNLHYGAGNLTGEHIIAANGEKGPQAKIIPPGFHLMPLVRIFYEIVWRQPFLPVATV